MERGDGLVKRILSFGYDTNLLLPEDPQNESQTRQAFYCDRLNQQRAIVVMTMQRMAQSEQHLFNNKLLIAQAYGRRFWTRVWQAYQQGLRLVKTFQPDLVEYQDPKIAGLVAYGVARRHNLPLLGQLHNEQLNDMTWLNMRWSHRIYNQIGLFVLAHSDQVRCVNSRQVTFVKQLGVKTVERIPVFIPDLERFIVPNSIQKARLKQWDKDPVVICAARLVAEKNFPLLLQAFAEVYHLTHKGRLVVLGDGVLKASLMHLTADLGIGERVEWAGHVEYQQVPLRFQEANLFALASDAEGGPRVAAQAQASRLPTVITEVGYARDIVREGVTGYILPVGDLNGFAAALKRLMTDRKIYRRMLELESFYDHSQFGEANIIEAMRAIYEKAL